MLHVVSTIAGWVANSVVSDRTAREASNRNLLCLVNMVIGYQTYTHTDGVLFQSEYFWKVLENPAGVCFHSGIISHQNMILKMSVLRSINKYCCHARRKSAFEHEQNDQIYIIITKTRLYKYIENFTSKNWKFSHKNSDIFFIFLLKT